MQIIRTATATWVGGIRDGSGKVSTDSGALRDHPYGFGSRFEGGRGTNPEELIAAAHASCFTMALTLTLGKNGRTQASLDVQAAVKLEEVDDGYAISESHLTLLARVPGLDEEAFKCMVAEAEALCPVSKLLRSKVTVDARLEWVE